MTSSRSHQGGNAVLLILIGVALFGALAYTFMRGAKEGQGNMSTQQAKIGAQEIINYSQDVEKAVDRIRNKGCSESQINFYDEDTSTLFNAYPNAAAPVDKHCDVFDLAGGGINVWKMPSNYSATGTAGWTIQPKAFLNILGTPTLKSDLVLLFSEINKNICANINNLLGVANDSSGNPPVDNAWTFNYDYTTYYTANNDGLGNAVGQGNYQKPAGCILWGSNYTFYYTLIAN